MPQRIAIYPGSFDPMTNGHFDIVQRCASGFDKIIVAVAMNPAKKPLFTVQERVEIIRKTVKDMDNVETHTFEGLTVEYARKVGANYLLRGLRAISDFESELQMAMVNRKLAPEVVTFFVMPDARFFFVSSTMIKDIYRLGGPVDCYLPEPAFQALGRKLGPV